MDANTTLILATSSPSTDPDDLEDTIFDDLLIFQISAAVLSVACIIANSALCASAIYSRKPRTACRAKGSIYLSQAIAGFLSPLSFVYPSQLCKLRFLSSPPNATLQFLTNYSSCFTTSIIPIVISLISPVAHNFLLTLEIYLPLLGCQLSFQHWVFITAFLWFLMLLLATLPWFGWNSWNDFCYIPSVWTDNYITVIAMLFILQSMACTYMLIGTFIRSRAGKESLTEEVVSKRYLNMKIPASAAKTRFAVLLILLLCDLPLILHILVHMSEVLQPLFLMNMAKDDTVLPWTIFMSLLSSAIIPPLTILTDPQLYTAIFSIAQNIWCCKPRYIRTSRYPPRRNNAVSPASADWDRDSR